MTCLYPFGWVCRNEDCMSCAIIMTHDNRKQTGLIHYNSLDFRRQASVKDGYLNNMRVIRMIPL